MSECRLICFGGAVAFGSWCGSVFWRCVEGGRYGCRCFDAEDSDDGRKDPRTEMYFANMMATFCRHEGLAR